MPQEDDNTYEKAEADGHVSVIQSDDIRSTLSSLQATETQRADEVLNQQTTGVETIDVSDYNVLAIDGSPAIIPLERYGDGEVAFLRVSIVEIDESLFNIKPQLVDTDLSDSIDTTRIHIGLPLNGFTQGANTLRESWRRLLADQFRQQSAFGDTLSDLVNHLTQYEGLRIDCPNPECSGTDIPIGDQCGICGAKTYASDVVNTYKDLTIRGDNSRTAEGAMRVVENLCVLAATQYAANRDDTYAVVKDGALAEYRCNQKWLSSTLNKAVTDAQRGTDTVVMGISKSGIFHDHLEQVDDRLSQGDVVAFSNDYIRDYVQNTEENDVFGRDSYYGKQFGYKDNHDVLRVFDLPRRYADDGSLLDTVADYPDVQHGTNLIESFYSPQFEGLIPLTLGHRKAAIPQTDTAKEALRRLIIEETE